MTNPPCKARRHKVCFTHCSCGMSGSSSGNKQIQWFHDVVVQSNSLDTQRYVVNTLGQFAYTGTQMGWEMKNAQQTPQVSSIYHFWAQTTKPAWKRRVVGGEGEPWASKADSRGHMALAHNFYWVDYISLPVSACLSCSLSRTWPISFCK